MTTIGYATGTEDVAALQALLNRLRLYEDSEGELKVNYVSTGSSV